MKTFSLLSVLLLFAFLANAQDVIFHEDFEAPGYDTTFVSSDSLISTSNPIPNLLWTRDSTLFSEGASSVHRQVFAGNTCFLTTQTFSTAGYTTVILNFDHICKVDFLDLATIEVSADAGNTWTQLTGLQYTGAGNYATNGNRFACNSYGTLWQPANPSEVPQNSWWHSESFDVTALLADLPAVQIRFKLADGGVPGPNSNYGWNIDNFRVEGNSQIPISGVVTYNNQANTPIAGAVVTLKQGNVVVSTDTTDASGNYSFSSCPSGSCELTVTSNLTWGGGAATDALSILRHFTGMQLLTDLHFLAADINGDHAVNAIDALMIEKRFVGMITTFPVGDWIFDPVTFTYPQTDPIIININGLCYGDVNGSYIPY